ncbi:MAG: hypothetical protein NT080_13365 [Spirochaetes bacterium]|nr:hypothetical protein [Spirochaetota bacterium]
MFGCVLGVSFRLFAGFTFTRGFASLGLKLDVRGLYVGTIHEQLGLAGVILAGVTWSFGSLSSANNRHGILRFVVD